MADYITSVAVPAVPFDIELTYNEHELFLYVTNDRDLYDRIKGVIVALRRKSRKNTYDHNKAVKAWRYVADRGNFFYKKDFGGNGFKPAERENVAKRLADYYLDDIEGAGGWDDED